MLEEMRARAREKRELVYADPASTDRDRKKADMVVEFLCKELGFNQVPRSTVLHTFIYLGCDVSVDEYYEMYDEVMKEVNQVFTYVEADDSIEEK